MLYLHLSYMLFMVIYSFFKEKKILYTSTLSCFKSQNMKKTKEECFLLISSKLKILPVAKLVTVSKASRQIWSSSTDILKVGLLQMTYLILLYDNRNLGTEQISTFSEVTYNVMQYISFLTFRYPKNEWLSTFFSKSELRRLYSFKW